MSVNYVCDGCGAQRPGRLDDSLTEWTWPAGWRGMRRIGYGELHSCSVACRHIIDERLAAEAERGAAGTMELVNESAPDKP